MSTSSPTNQIVDHLFRHEAGKMIAVLSRLFGLQNIPLVEDVVQEAFLKAAQTWKYNHLPENPSAWLMQVAKNKALDLLRRQQNFHQLSSELGYLLEKETEQTIEHFFLPEEIEDSQLRMIFACCHPLLNTEDQIAITLKTISGFGIPEIAKALVTNEEVIKKRISRAKQFIKENNIQLEIPTGAQLVKRLDTVYTILYLLFNEGYSATRSEMIIRKDICAEAMRLCLLLSRHKAGNVPETFALLSLMCFHASRFESRMDDSYSIILLQQQDRSKWNKELIALGYKYLNESAQGDHLSVYHLEAAIAAEHCRSSSFEHTDWKRLLRLYDLLLLQKKTTFVRLNRAVVIAHVEGPEKAIQHVLFIEGIEELINKHYIYSAVLGDLYLQNGQLEQARNYLNKAYELTQSPAERKLLESKIKSTR